MPPSIVDQISSSPALKWIVLAILFHILNAFLGAFMAFFRRGYQIRRIHWFLYLAVLACLACFLMLNGIHSNNSIWEYLVCAYFITILPISKRWDVIFHAFIAVIGLLLLPLLIILNVSGW